MLLCGLLKLKAAVAYFSFQSLQNNLLSQIEHACIAIFKPSTLLIYVFPRPQRCPLVRQILPPIFSKFAKSQFSHGNWGSIFGKSLHTFQRRTERFE